MFRCLCVLFLVFWSGGLGAEMRVYQHGEVPDIKELQAVLLQGKAADNGTGESRLGSSKGFIIGARTEPKASVGQPGISLPILFENASSELRNDQNTRQILENIFRALQNQNLKIIIEGHTDALGSKAYNISLSKQRAATVKNYLLKRGIKESLLITSGMGYASPLPGTAPVDAINRRVQFRVIN